ncbi:MAG: hypothetical protein KY460_02890 [Actinobacteria bacterium]|nr:hypothetical protein [Actinomycetota bacterium]
MAQVAEQLGELRAVLEAELRRAEVIAHELERLGEPGTNGADQTQLPATA